MKLLIVSLALILAGCVSTKLPGQMSPKESGKLSRTIGPWENPYRGDPNLAGVVIEQYPEGIGPKAPYENKHPASIWYVFWNGDVKSIQYTPEGSIMVASLWKNEFKRGSSDWNEVDYSNGSDPKFERHKDPRKAG